jgi:hypothetical protein
MAAPIENPYAQEPDQEPSMPASSTRNFFLITAGFGIGALVILFAFVFLIGIGDVGQTANTAATPAAKSAANAPMAPGPAPNPAPNTASPAVPSTTGQAPAPANPNTPKAQTQGQAREQK